MNLKHFVIAVSLLLIVATASAEEIKIGVLVDLSGPLTTYGSDIRNTLTIAEEKINSYFKENGLDYSVRFLVEDTKVDSNLALQIVQNLYAQGVNLIIGPMSSGEVANIKDYVTSNKIIIISPSSTALPKIIGFAKPEDKKYIFRFVGTDDLQTDVIAAELRDAGIKGVVITHIGNAWGKGLYETIKPKLEDLGIEIAKKVVEYPEQTPADFTPYIESLAEGVKELVNKYGYDKVALVAFSYEEAFTMLAQTPEDSELLKVVWFGCDGTAKSGRISEAMDKAIKVGVYSTLFESKGKVYDELAKKYKEKGYGDTPYQYAMNAYDAAWVLALAYVETVNETGRYDPDVMVEKIREVTEKYCNGEYGVEPVTGEIILNEWNDRASGDYAIWYVSEKGRWDLAGVWKFESGSVEWYHKPTPPAVETTPKKTPGFELVLAILGIALAIGLRRR